MISIQNSFINLKLQNSIFSNISSFTKSLQRLVTGFKINTPSDDPAGFFVSSNFTSQIRGLETANKNIQTAVNMLNTADTSIKEINDIMGQIRDLVVKGCNEYMTPEEREANQKKINDLFKQAQNIKDNTTFNGNSLFSNSTTLDKNKTYKNDRETTVRTASNQVLTLRSSDHSPGASSPDEGIPLASTFALDSAQIADAPTESAPLIASPRMAMLSASATSAPSIIEGGTTGSLSNLSGREAESKTVRINDKIYTITANGGQSGRATGSISWSVNSDGEIVLQGQNVNITAAEGQSDKLIIDGGDMISVSTGDMNDTIKFQNISSSYLSANGGTGTNYILDSSNSVNISNAVKVEDWGTSGSKTLTAGNPVTASINGKIYTFDYNASAGESINLTYSTNNGQIIFNNHSSTDYQKKLTITAADGQVDNVKIQDSYNVEFFAGDMNDTIEATGGNIKLHGGEGDDNITMASTYGYVYGDAGNDTITLDHQYIDYAAQNGVYGFGGDGNDSFITAQKGYGATNTNIVLNGGSGTNSLNNYGTNTSGTNIQNVTGNSLNALDLSIPLTQKTLSANETITLQINSNTYTIHNRGAEATFNYSSNSDGVITFEGTFFEITAADGQEDNIIIKGAHNIVNTGDMDDNVTIASQYISEGVHGSTYTSNSYGNTVHAGDGNDKINIEANATGNSIYGENGNDIVHLGSSDAPSRYNQIDGGTGTNTVYNLNQADTTNTLTNVQNNIAVENWSDTGSKTINAGETKTVRIVDKIYTIYSAEGGTVNYSASTFGNGASDQLTIDTNNMIITAADGQVDNIKLAGHDNQLFAGDMDDTIIVGDTTKWDNYNNIVHGGGGNDNITMIATSGTAYGDAGDDILTLQTYGMSTSGIQNGVSGFGGDGNDTFITTSTDAQPITVDGGTGTNSIQNQGTNTLGQNFQNITGDALSDPLNWGTSGSRQIAANSTVTGIIDGKTYTFENTTSSAITLNFSTANGQITLEKVQDNWQMTAAPELIITAAEGQADNIRLKGYNMELFAGDMDDTIEVCPGEYECDADNNIVHGGSGNDTITMYATNGVIYGDAGNDTIIAGQAGGMAPDLKVFGGDGDDNITVMEYSQNITVDGGIGVNTIDDKGTGTTSSNVINAENWGTSGTKTLNSGQTVTASINGKIYTITNTHDSAQNFTYSTDSNGVTTIESFRSEITAADGQEDKLIINGYHNTVNTGDANDIITINNDMNILKAGNGNNNITVNGHNNTITSGDGEDDITVYGGNNKIDAGAGNDNIKLGNETEWASNYLASDNTILGGAGDDIITAYHSTMDNKIYAQDGNDTVIMGGWNGETIADGGFGNDTISSLDGGDLTNTDNITGFGSKKSGSIIMGYHDYEDGNARTVNVNGKEYQIKLNNITYTDKTLNYSYNETTGEITFEGEWFDISAADGQEDKIIIKGHHNMVNTGDMDDTITLAGASEFNTVKAGAGNDKIILGKNGEQALNNIIYGGSGTNTLIDRPGSPGSLHIENIQNNIIAEDWGTSGTKSLAANSSVTAEINGKIYTFESTTGAAIDLTYSTGADGKITINKTYTAADLTELVITAAEGQVDNVALMGNNIEFFAGDMDDIIEVGDVTSGSIPAYNNTVHGGDGNDTITILSTGSIAYGDAGNDNFIFKSEIGNIAVGGSGTDTVTYEPIEGQGYENHNSYIENGNVVRLSSTPTVVTINGKTYNVSTTDTSYGPILVVGDYEGTLSFDNNSLVNVSTIKEENGKTVITGKNLIITAADGQTDDIVLNGNSNTLNTGNMNDTVTVNGSSNSIDGGVGSNTLIDNGTNNTAVNFGLETSGAVTVNSGESKTFTIDGKTYTVVNNGTATSSLGWELDTTTNEISFSGRFLGVTAANGQQDIIKWDVQSGSLDTGDQNDTIKVTEWASNNNINSGSGDDTIVVNSSGNMIWGGDGDDTTILNADSNEVYTGLGTGDLVIENAFNNWVTYSFHTNESKVVTIDGKTYTIKNNGRENNDLAWSVDQHDAPVYFRGSNFEITAADGQDDNIYLEYGSNNIVNPGNGNNNITVNGYDNTINKDDSGSTTVIDNGNGTAIQSTNSASINFGVNETKTIDIHGKQYTVVNNGDANNTLEWSYNTSTGEITFSGESFEVTAASNQTDNIIWGIHSGKLDTGDLNDTIKIVSGQPGSNIDGQGSEIISNSGDNTIINNAYNVHITTGSGNDNISLGQGSYLNDTGGTNTVIADSYNNIHLGSGADTVTLTGEHNNLDTGAGDDNITVASDAKNNTINAGAGNDVINNNGINSVINGGDGADILKQNTVSETKLSGIENVKAINNENNLLMNLLDEVKVEIGGKTYNVSRHWGTSGDKINYTYDSQNDQISFDAKYHTIKSDTNQTNNIIINGANNIYEGYGLENNITVNGKFHNISTGNSDSNITLNGSQHSVYAGSGNDTIIVNGDSNEYIDSGAGNDTIIVYGNDNSKIDTRDGNDKITINGNNNKANAGAGDDYVVVTGSNNTIDGGTTGYDKIINKGKDNTYTHMNELVDKDSSFNIQVSGNIADNSKFELSLGMLLPDMTIDISSRENAIESLKQLDEVILGLTTSRVDIGFQNNMLDSIMKTNLTRITNLNNSLSTVRDADTAVEYNNLLAKAALIDTGRLLQLQATQNHANILAQLINGIAS